MLHCLNRATLFKQGCCLSCLGQPVHYDESTYTESLNPYHVNLFIVCSIWNRTACDQAVTNRIRDTFRRVWILHLYLRQTLNWYIDSLDTFRRAWIYFLSLLVDVELIYFVHSNFQTTHFQVLRFSLNFFFQVLSLPTGTAIEYKAHNDSLKWARFLTFNLNFWRDWLFVWIIFGVFYANNFFHGGQKFSKAYS